MAAARLSRNEGAIDRSLRVVLGVTLLIVAFLTGSLLLGAVALVPLVTGLVGTCPLYSLVGINTLGKKAAS